MKIWVILISATVVTVLFISSLDRDVLVSFGMYAGTSGGTPRLVGLIALAPILVVGIWAVLSIIGRKINRDIQGQTPNNP